MRRLDVDTPCGRVHLVAFPKGVDGVPYHRDVIFDVLSEYVGAPISQADLVLVESASKSGTPKPTFPNLDFDANWTHSGHECVLAYGERHTLVKGVGLHLGVDMEVHSPKHLRLAKRFYSPEENALLEQLPEEERMKEFYRLWCRKEALFKCVGGSFFAGSVTRNVLDNPLMDGELADGFLSDGGLDGSRKVYFTDLPWAGPASLCIATYK